MTAIIVHYVGGECFILHYELACPWKSRSQLLRWVLNKELDFGWHDCRLMAGLIRSATVPGTPWTLAEGL